MLTFTAHIVVGDSICCVLRHILSPIATYCRRRQYMLGFTRPPPHIVVCDSICGVLRHILSPIATYCRRQQYMLGFTAHIVAHRHILSSATIYAATVECLQGRGERQRQTDRQADRERQRERQRHIERDRDRETETDRQRQTDRQTDRQTENSLSLHFSSRFQKCVAILLSSPSSSSSSSSSCYTRSHTPSSENLFLFVEGGCSYTRSLWVMSEDSPHITTQRGITTFHCSPGVHAGDSVFLHSAA